jgi:hypothetical protein
MNLKLSHIEADIEVRPDRQPPAGDDYWNVTMTLLAIDRHHPYSVVTHGPQIRSYEDERYTSRLRQPYFRIGRHFIVLPCGMTGVEQTESHWPFDTRAGAEEYRQELVAGLVAWNDAPEQEPGPCGDVGLNVALKHIALGMVLRRDGHDGALNLAATLHRLTAHDPGLVTLADGGTVERQGTQLFYRHPAGVGVLKLPAAGFRAGQLFPKVYRRQVPQETDAMYGETVYHGMHQIAGALCAWDNAPSLKKKTLSHDRK